MRKESFVPCLCLSLGRIGTDGRKGVKREKWRKWWRREENFLRKSSQALGSSENALRLGVSCPLDLTLYVYLLK